MGLALPRLAFMTWPTSALKAFSLPARNSSTDFWLCRQHLVDERLDRPAVGDLPEAWASMIASAVAPSPFQCLEDLSGDVVGDGVVGDAGNQTGELRGADRRSVEFELGLVERATRSPITQLAQVLASAAATVDRGLESRAASSRGGESGWRRRRKAELGHEALFIIPPAVQASARTRPSRLRR